jgi:hypothetical protein
MAFPFLQRGGNLAEYAGQLQLATYAPVLSLQGLALGVDNVRHDVYLSPKFCDVARQHIARLIAKYGGVEDLAIEPSQAPTFRPPSVVKPAAKPDEKALDPADFKRLLTDLHLAALNRAKTEGNISLDLLARLAVLKFLRTELGAQFAILLERCRARLKAVEGPRQANPKKEIELRERAAAFQLAKKIVLRKAGQELFHTLREMEKETLLRMRRSLFPDGGGPAYELFLNRLLFTPDGRDDYLNAEQYVMLGNFHQDPDRYDILLEVSTGFLKSLGVAADADAVLCAPDNAQEMVAGGTPDDSPKGKMQKALLDAWMGTLERAGVMEHVIASYEAAPLLPEYARTINPQQLKNALISRQERARVLGLLEAHGKVSRANLEVAVKRVNGCRGAERAKVAGRFLRDLMRYHRDLRRMEATILGMDSVNLIASDKLRELSAINRTLYEFLLAEEQKPAEDKVIHHIIIKADIRDSTTLTRTLFERGLNPASYFSLNFYEPVNKLLPKYDAGKVFIEGDAVILALFEREGEAELQVARACVLAKEMIEIVRAYNEQSQKAGLPTLELGIGISYQDSAPMYLMDGESRIMISKALNESDRLSSCSKSARHFLAAAESLFNVYALETVEEADTAGSPEEFLVRYNVGGIHISEAAFQKLQQEISLQPLVLEVPPLWPGEEFRLFSGLVPVGAGSFHRVVVRQGRVPHIDPRDFSLKRWTGRLYYEICTTAAIYEYIEHRAATGA